MISCSFSIVWFHFLFLLKEINVKCESESELKFPKDVFQLPSFLFYILIISEHHY